MRKIELSYALSAAEPAGGRPPFLLRNPMMDVLHAVQGSGSISGIAMSGASSRSGNCP
jgi:putative molybdopterin biosynthesis protein